MEKHCYSGQILVVDDDILTAELLQVGLEDIGFRVTLGHDLETLRSKVLQRTFDYVLLDLFLEKESGLDAIPFLLRESPYSKIIVMSALGTVEIAVDAMEKGASSFVSKSKDPKDLVNLLKAKLNSGVAGSASLAEPSGNNYGIIGTSTNIQSLLEKIQQVKDIDSIVLISGESGTGKELVARAIHKASNRCQGRFEAVNCGAIPENLIESELFGHKRGAFTDAKSDRKGLFELCEDGTLFLDEIGELPLAMQVKLLRVLQEKEVMPLGAGQSIKVNARIITATNKSLPVEVKNGTFRSDLYYRLNVLQLNLTPLRERANDIPLLVLHFLSRFNLRFSRSILAPSTEVQARLMAYQWPGNIRELQNALERGVVLSKDNSLSMADMLDFEVLCPSETTAPRREEEIWSTSLSDAKKNFEKAYLERLLESTGGNISEIARVSGRYRTDIYRLMNKYGVEKPENRNPI